MKYLRSILLLLTLLGFSSCGDNGGGEPEDPVDDFDRKELLIDVADGIIIPVFEDYT